MWHKVDFRNHSYYDQFHPLFFLTVREPIWNLVSQPDPTLNRCRLSHYRRLAAGCFATTRIWITHIVARPELLPHRQWLGTASDFNDDERASANRLRQQLAPRLDHLSDEDLLVDGAFFICQGAGVLPQSAQRGAEYAESSAHSAPPLRAPCGKNSPAATL
jgi:hypothetical protein